MAPRIVAQILQDLLVQIMTDPTQVRAPMPLPAWIPKATAELTADNWRPLGLPTVFLRVLAAVLYRHIVAHNPRLLHGAQALLNDFREPQGNFLDMQGFLEQSLENNEGFVFVTDFMKAFEVVNPHFIIAVLAARGSPLWLLSHARYILYGRIVVPKVHGKLLPGLQVQVGVDMVVHFHHSSSV